MKLMRFVGPVSAACSLTLVTTGPALASNDVALQDTGSGSTQVVEIQKETTVSTTNTNVVSVFNESSQSSSTGGASAAKNTNVEGAGVTSGDAQNSNVTTTTVTIDNASEGTGTGNGNGNGNGEGQNPGSGQSNGSQTGGSGQGGNVLGASTGGAGGGVAKLPKVGATNPIDVSALRAALLGQIQNGDQTGAASFVQQARNTSSIMLAVAALLSLVGAIGSAVYAARRKEGRV